MTRLEALEALATAACKWRSRRTRLFAGGGSDAVQSEAEAAMQRALDAVDVAIDPQWRKDRPGWYWARWPGLEWTLAHYIVPKNADGFWTNGGPPPEIGPAVVPPPWLPK